MKLNVTVEHGSTELELDLDELDKYGSYFIDRERGLIIHAFVYTHGTRDSRYVRGDVTCGTDYIFKGVSVNREWVREYIDAELQVEISDGELETAVSEYHVCSTEVVGRFSEMLDGKRILGKAQSGVVSTGSEEPLLGWEDVFSDVVDRALEENDDLPRRDIVRELFKALCEATPGENKYSARIELVNPS